MNFVDLKMGCHVWEIYRMGSVMVVKNVDFFACFLGDLLEPFFVPKKGLKLAAVTVMSVTFYGRPL